MAVLNNWDLKDANNSVYLTHSEPIEERYAVSDLGDSFGPTGLNLALKGNPKAYYSSKMIGKTSPEFVNFNIPSGPPVFYFLNVPEMALRFSLVWLGKHIPRQDARWMGICWHAFPKSRFKMRFGPAVTLHRKSRLSAKRWSAGSRS